MGHLRNGDISEPPNAAGPSGRDVKGDEKEERDAALRRRGLALALAIGLYLSRITRAGAEDHVDYRYESYKEENGRIGVDTQSWLFEKKITPWLTLKGDAVYDSISGATPTGAPPPNQINSPFPLPGPLGTTVPTAFMRDQRYAGSMDFLFQYGPHHLTPEVSYSTEHDYTSVGAALNYSLDLNHKNTRLDLGWAHDWDTVLPWAGEYITGRQHKESDNILIGVSQLLSPWTILTADFTFRNSSGYLNDPYRGVLFDDYPQVDPNNPSLFPENRPNYRESYIAYVSVLHYFDALNGSAEGSYRYYYDTFGINAQTIGLSWHQKIGRHVVISPMFRYYVQTAASFYGTQFPGDPSISSAGIPTYYSADYRLSNMETFAAGVEATFRIRKWLSLDVGYKFYQMKGLDGVTSSSAYPTANIVTIGARLWF
jgi:hypothetical protein